MTINKREFRLQIKRQSRRNCSFDFCNYAPTVGGWLVINLYHALIQRRPDLDAHRPSSQTPTMLPIHRYAAAGDLDALKRELDLEVAVDLRDPDEELTPLMVAVRSGRLDAVRFLLENGADVNAQAGPEQRPVLYEAVRNGDPALVELLLDAGADIGYRSESGYGVTVDAMFGRDVLTDEQLIPLFQLLIARGARLDDESDYFESALSVASHLGRFDLIRLLLDAGADPDYLEWTPLMRAVGVGTVEDVRAQLEAGEDVGEIDRWDRTPFLISLQTGDLDKVRLLAAVSNQHAVGHTGQTALMHALASRQVEVLKWLIEQGHDINAKDEFGRTPLILAAMDGATECVRVLIEAGADVTLTDARPGTTQEDSDQARAALDQRIEEFVADNPGQEFDFSSIDLSDIDMSSLGSPEGQRPIEHAANLDIVRLLVAAGEDLNAISPEMRAQLIGQEYDGEPDCSIDDFEEGREPGFGHDNPDKMEIPFWDAMVRSGASAWRARDLFGDVELNDSTPVWSFQRFGKSINELPDGRIIEIGGEHEDAYDVDFCIYNDVFVHHGDGTFDIYGYPEEDFPPTDFHTATLVGDHIYIIGCLGYPDLRRPNETPLYRLNTGTLAIEEVKTSGENPGWISRHRATYNASTGEIEISGGKLVVRDEEEEDYVDNEGRFALNLESLTWRRM